MDVIGNYTVKHFNRVINAEVVELSRNRLYMVGFVELDITKAREMIQTYKEKTGERISFTGWIAYCVGHAVANQIEVQAFKKRKKLIIFDDVDISITVEKIVDNRVTPILLVIRKANEKSVKEIHDEIRAVQKRDDNELSTSVSKKKLNLLFSLPKFVRQLIFWRRVKNNPHYYKKLNGTVLITAIGMFGKGRRGWGSNLGFAPVCIVIGGISKQLKQINGKIENREFLNLTIKVDHITLDGGPASRFVNDLMNFIEDAQGLEEFIA